jgi:hypothetical protein
MRPLPVMALGAALLTASALAVAGCGTRIGTTTSRNSYTITEPVTSLKIDNPVGSTQIEGTDTNTISVTEQLSYSGNPPQTSYPITGDGHLGSEAQRPDHRQNGAGDQSRAHREQRPSNGSTARVVFAVQLRQVGFDVLWLYHRSSSACPSTWAGWDCRAATETGGCSSAARRRRTEGWCPAGLSGCESPDRTWCSLRWINILPIGWVGRPPLHWPSWGTDFPEIRSHREAVVRPWMRFGGRAVRSCHRIDDGPIV